MRAIAIQGGFGLDNLALIERPDPEPGPGQVLLKMRAASLNYRDLMMIQGLYNPRQPLPLIPLSDGVGEVIAVGEGVDRVRVGERVMPCFHQNWWGGRPTHERVSKPLGGPLDGVLAEQMVVRQEGLVRAPEHLSDAEAASLPCAAVTAWAALVTEGRVQAGDIVLVQGTGGVSLFALQFAKALGAQVIVTSSSDAKLERALALGADHGINYKTTPKWGKAARAWTQGAGVDHIVEVGGAGTLEQSLSAAAIGGHISLIGVLSGIETPLKVTSILMRQIRVQGIFVGARDSFEAMNRAIHANGIKPVIDRVFPFTEARAALEHMASGSHFGKIALSFT